MKVLLLLALVGLGVCSEFMRQNEKALITVEYLEKQKVESPFEVYSYETHPFRGWSESQLKSLLGLSTRSLKDTSNVEYDINAVNDLPEKFDSRNQWPECIHDIRDQGHCGSCWAHAASEVLSDRFCIASKGKINVVLSPQDMVSCDYFDMGCNGGIPTASWLFLRLFGIVSDSCKPYTSGDGKVEWCSPFSSKCTAAGHEYKKYKAKSFYSLSSIDAIKKSIHQNGPVETGFSVYDDFINYKSGIYKKGSNASFLGGHAVKIVGWAKENGVEHWIVANSWNTTWGEQGYFRIAFRECGIENCIAGDPLL
jgi:cathepsin B